jgi:Na+-translocating ferredoxin:NAD+ oxidoreductase subunit A
MEYLILAINAILVGNLVLAKFLGICPFLGVSKKVSTALGMSAAVTFVMTLAAVVVWGVNRFLLVPLSLEYLRIIAFILVIASLVQLTEMVLQKFSPALYDSLGIYLPLITTNCAILGVAVLNVDFERGLVATVVYSFSAAIGFTVALLLFAGIRERLETSDIPDAFEGAATALITAGILSLAFMGFAGLVPG